MPARQCRRCRPPALRTPYPRTLHSRRGLLACAGDADSLPVSSTTLTTQRCCRSVPLSVRAPHNCRLLAACAPPATCARAAARRRTAPAAPAAARAGRRQGASTAGSLADRAAQRIEAASANGAVPRAPRRGRARGARAPYPEALHTCRGLPARGSDAARSPTSSATSATGWRSRAVQRRLSRAAATAARPAPPYEPCRALAAAAARRSAQSWQPPQCIGELAMGPGSAMRTRAPAAGAVLCERRAHLPVAVPAGRVDATPAGTPPLLPFTCAGLIKKIVTHRRKACDHTKPTVPH